MCTAYGLAPVWASCKAEQGVVHKVLCWNCSRKIAGIAASCTSFATWRVTTFMSSLMITWLWTPQSSTIQVCILILRARIWYSRVDLHRLIVLAD